MSKKRHYYPEFLHKNRAWLGELRPKYLGKKTGYDGAIVSTDNGVEENLIEPGVEVSFQDSHFLSYQLRVAAAAVASCPLLLLLLQECHSWQGQR